MLFTSFTFIFYFLPAVLILYYLFRFSGRLKNVTLLFASLLFYAWGNVGYLFILLFSILVNYFFGLVVGGKSGVRRFAMIGMCVYNIGMIFAFKYLPFTVSGFNEVFGTGFAAAAFGRPVGLSFFTFKAMSYVTDIYRGKVPPERNIINTALYLSIFPQIEAGPVVQYADIAGQLEYRRENMRMFSVGCCRFVSGLAKKLLLANQLGLAADRVFEMSAAGEPVPALLAWVGSIAFTLQVFFDVSGYSDIAIGLCLMLGFRICENFNYPYISKSMTEFWRRWHISLTQWFREYVYKSLGGDGVKNNDLVVRNLLLVWLLTGLWHGADWTFIIWGLLNFALIFLEKLTGLEKSRRHTGLRRAYTLCSVNLLWVVFRSESLVDAGLFISSMFFWDGFYSPLAIAILKENFAFFALGILLSTTFVRRLNRFLVDKAPFSFAFTVIYPVYMVALLGICVAYLVKDVQYPFIYFNY